MILLWLACTYDPAEFAPAFARVACVQYDECGFLLYGEEKNCRERTERDVDETTSCIADHCRFDSEAAAACIDAIREADCQVFGDGTAFAACTDVWTLCDVEGEGCQLP